MLHLKSFSIFIAAFLCMSTLTFSQNFTDKDLKMFDEGYVMTEKDIRPAHLSYERGTDTKPRLYSIENDKDETKVTFLQPIYFDSQWLHYGKGFKLVDVKTGDQYLSRGYDGGLPNDRLLIVKGHRGEYIFITLRFPKLKKRVEVINIIEQPMPTDLIPSNDDGILKSYYGVHVKSYKVNTRKEPKIYK
ncbi:MAG: hypothetical protein H9789_09270 [Candidatus Paraprevotella stercoravium]|jgi:hypothetical protein|uniref:DUF4833 domain-containing protein n=2 Tax=Bacteroidales TaxID=171549 RepID=A0ABT7U759_9BACE|nr:hypothetical protein [Candidatus Paraprevotella stercoravium]MDM8146329.1 hypothetical protein [Bacteroides eggerthii]